MQANQFGPPIRRPILISTEWLALSLCGEQVYVVPGDRKLTARSRKRTTAAIIFWTSLVDFELAAPFILSVQTLYGRVSLRDIAHRNEPKASGLAGLAICDEFDFGHRAERLKEIP
jgi:hypothetical protein